MLSLNFFLGAILGTAALAAPSPIDPSNSMLAERDLNTNLLLDAILKAFPGSMTVDGACNIISVGELAIARQFGISDTSNSNGCADVTVVFARGTCDPGNVGVLVGPPFFNELAKALGGRTLNVQGVEYPATVTGYLNADTAAGNTMAQIVRSTRASCPNTKIVLSGYSQGGFAVHNAADALGQDMANVSAAVVFGDPYSHKPVANIDASKVLIVCHDGDDICQQGFLIFPQHLTYAIDAKSASAFVVSKL